MFLIDEILKEDGLIFVIIVVENSSVLEKSDFFFKNMIFFCIKYWDLIFIVLMF